MMLNHKEYGDGYPVIILHGLLGMLDNWHSFAKKLSADYKVITLDQRNHGKSFHSEVFSYPLLSQDLKNFLDVKEIKRCHLIGHSMGGKTVMQFQRDFPEHVDKGIIVDIAPKEYVGGHELIFKTLLELDLHEVESRKDAAEKVNAKILNQNVVLFLLKNLTRGENNSYKWKANIQALWKNYSVLKSFIQDESKIEIPSLFVRGTKSGYISDEDLSLISDLYTDATVETIEDAGHWIHAEKPDELLEVVLDFL